jgi:hypothetical protein
MPVPNILNWYTTLWLILLVVENHYVEIIDGVEGSVPTNLYHAMGNRSVVVWEP